MKRTWSGVLVAMLLVAVVLFAGACAGKKKEAGKEAGKAASTAGKIIGVSLLKENDDFYITLKKGLEDAAKTKGYQIEILSADNDEQKQDNNMDALLLKNVSAIVICPVNSKGVGAIIKKATDKNIPVFTADIAAEQGKVVAHMASDNEMGGKLAAMRMIELVGSKGKIAIVQQPGTESVAMRVKGFVDTAKAAGLTILEPLLNGKDDTQESERVTNAVLLGNKDLKGVFAANDNMAMGAEAAINASGMKIPLIGYDAALAAQEKIKAGGVWKADVIQYPAEIGGVTINTIDKYLKGQLKAADKTVFVPVKVGLVDAKSMGAAK